MSKSFWKLSFFIILGFLITSNLFWAYSMRDRLILFYRKVRFEYQTQGFKAFEKRIPKFVRSCKYLESIIGGTDNHYWNDKQVDERISKYRTAEVELLVTNATGILPADYPVTIRQVRHKFLFGCNLISFNPIEENQHSHRFEEIFNYATLSFFWGLYEGFEGKTDVKRISAMAEWCQQRKIITKGHPLVWQVIVPNWIRGMGLDEVKRFLWRRVYREVKEFVGLVDKWDVVNEGVAGLAKDIYNYSPVCLLYHQIGQLNLMKETFSIARKANPNSTLVLNDFVVDAWYEKLITDCLEVGVGIDAIGIQSHMHKGFWSLEKMWDVCERFTRFGKPLHFTEMTVLSGRQMSFVEDDWYSVRDDWQTTEEGEEHQAKTVKKFYRLLFSYPAVEAISWWDFSDKGAWMGAPGGLLRKDMSPKPVYFALRKLIKEDWWTGPLTLKTDAEGQVSFRGFLGDYVIECEKGQGWFSIDQAAKVDKTVLIK